MSLAKFPLPRHELIEFEIPRRAARAGDNFLAFSMPKPPGNRDPYVYIHDLEVSLDPRK